MIFNNLLKALGSGEGKRNSEAAKRRYSRREADHCVAVIDNNIYPVQNWSMGGALIRADERHFAINDEIGLTIKFKLGETIRDVSQVARVVRKAQGKIAFQFAPLGRKTKRDFQNVINEYVTSQFADSQLV